MNSDLGPGGGRVAKAVCLSPVPRSCSCNSISTRQLLTPATVLSFTNETPRCTAGTARHRNEELDIRRAALRISTSEDQCAHARAYQCSASGMTCTGPASQAPAHSAGEQGRRAPHGHSGQKARSGAQVRTCRKGREAGNTTRKSTSLAVALLALLLCRYEGSGPGRRCCPHSDLAASGLSRLSRGALSLGSPSPPLYAALVSCSPAAAARCHCRCQLPSTIPIVI